MADVRAILAEMIQKMPEKSRTRCMEAMLRHRLDPNHPVFHAMIEMETYRSHQEAMLAQTTRMFEQAKTIVDHADRVAASQIVKSSEASSAVYDVTKKLYNALEKSNYLLSANGQHHLKRQIEQSIDTVHKQLKMLDDGVEEVADKANRILSQSFWPRFVATCAISALAGALALTALISPNLGQIPPEWRHILTVQECKPASPEDQNVRRDEKTGTLYIILKC